MIELLARQPFEPFTIRLIDDRGWVIDSPFASSPKGCGNEGGNESAKKNPMRGKYRLMLAAVCFQAVIRLFERIKSGRGRKG